MSSDLGWQMVLYLSALKQRMVPELSGGLYCHAFSLHSLSFQRTSKTYAFNELKHVLKWQEKFSSLSVIA